MNVRLFDIILFFHRENNTSGNVYDANPDQHKIMNGD